MAHSLHVICRPEHVAGFRLAGLETVTASDAADAAEAILELAADPGAGLVLVESPWLEALPEATRRRLARRALPILVPFPVPAWAAEPARAEAYVVELLRRAVGYQVRLR